MNKGSQEAKFDHVLRNMERGVTFWQYGWSSQWELAEDQHPPAMAHLAAEYEESERVPQDLAKAYYWHRRAGLEPSASLQQVLTPEDRRRAETWLGSGSVPPP